MNTDPAKTDNDAPAASPAAEGDLHEPTVPGCRTLSTSPGEYKSQHLGRQGVDRWMLHRTFMEDLADELASRAPSAAPSPAASVKQFPEPPPVSEK